MNHTQKINYASYIKFLQFPIRFKDATLANFPSSIREASLSVSLITGPIGVGKTHLLFALVENAVRQSVNCLTVHDVDYNGGKEDALVVYHKSILDLFADIKSVFSLQNERTEEEVISKYCIAKNLFLDDFGVHNNTAWESAIIYKILDYRWSNNLRTVISSNFSIQELNDNYGERLASRIIGTGDLLVLEGEDLRIKMGQMELKHKQTTKTSLFDLQKSDKELEDEHDQAKKEQIEKNRLGRLTED